MKVFALPIVGLVAGLLSFPVLFASGDSSLLLCGHLGGGVDVVLATIRDLESGGDYAAESRGSTASGAYQFIDSTWDGYGGYERAVNAPPAVQDAKALELVASVLDRYDGQVAVIPVAWYIGHVPDATSPTWDEVSVPDAGNVLTPREYQSRWLARFTELSDARGTPTEPQDTDPILTCNAGPNLAPLDGGWSYPGPPELFATADVRNPHHDYPAWDWGVPTGTPLYTVRGGTVATVQFWPHNWWDEGCTPTNPECSTCGVGVTVVDDHGNRWAYCHGSAAHVIVGQTVAAGQQILTSGNTGRSSGPHLHLQVRTADGVLRCPQPLLESLRDRSTGIDPTNLPSHGCSY